MQALTLGRFKTVPGTQFGTPKEVWGFRSARMRGPAPLIAKRFIDANQALLGLKGVRLRRTRIVESLGARHVIFQQCVRGLRIYRAYVTAHVARAGSVYLVKNRAVPVEFATVREEFAISEVEARRRARQSISKSAARLRFVHTERMWFPRAGGLLPSYRFRIARQAPRQDWIVYIDGATGRVLRRYDNLSERAARVRVFDPNPVIALGDSAPLVRPRSLLPAPEDAYRTVTVHGLSANGYLDGPRVTTRLTASRVRVRSGDFRFAQQQSGFEEVMAYFHIDRAIRYLETLGYRQARAIFRAPIAVDATGTDEDNSWYSPHDKSLTFGLGGVPDAEDADIILHELGHAIQDAICPDFGQSPEAAAMGEGFGDYFAASTFAEMKPESYRTSVGTWDGVRNVALTPPCVRRVDEELTYESFDHAADADEHENGMIWSAILWKIRKAVGRRVADRIVLESHFQLDGFTTFARGARAILDADHNLYGGRHVGRVRQIFRAAGVGPVE